MPDNDPGEKLAPEVVSEIQVVAPSTVTSGSITTAKLAEDAVTTGKIADDAVTTEKIADGGVETNNLAPESVTEGKIADGAVTPDKVGTGVVTAVDNTGSTIANREMFVTAAQMALITSPDPNTTYYISA